MGEETTGSEGTVSDRYTDAEGLIRKSSGFWGIPLWLTVAVMNIVISHLPDNLYLTLVSLLFWPVGGYLTLRSIQMMSSYDIDTWRGTGHVKLWIFLGSMLAGIVGVGIYFLLKGRERSFMKKHMAHRDIHPKPL